MSELTPVMGEEDRHRARDLSVLGLRPPLRVPGYEQERFLGKGAYGEVWMAVDSNNGRRVVIKFYSGRGGLDWSLLAREVDKLQHLFSDRHVVQLFDVGWNAEPPYYVMEYMERGSLEDLLRNGPLPADEAVALVREIAVGLVHAHGKGILHCDLKPANILLDQDGKPRLADFGQSRLSHEHAPALGTLFYMAPEQADLRAEPDARWDVYALGAILHQMLTGSPPYRTNPGADEALRTKKLEDRLKRYRELLRAMPKPADHRRAPGVDRGLAEIVDRCLAINPKARYANVQAVLNALDQRAARRARRPLMVLGTAGPALVMLVMGWVGAALFRETIGTATHEVVDHALESNRFAARSVVDRFALNVEKRWNILEQEAADADLRRRLGSGADRPPDPRAQADLSAWLGRRRDYWNRRFPAGTAASYWMVLDRAGRLQAIGPPTEGVLGRYFGYRDYFHGRGVDRASEAARPTPITRPHRSMVFRSKPKDVLTVAFSVPIPSLDPAATGPVGVLAMETELGHFADFRGSPAQFAALIDLREDASGRNGLIVEHPYLKERERERAPVRAYYVDPEVVRRAEALRSSRRDPPDRAATAGAGPSDDRSPSFARSLDFRGDYRDPVGGTYAGPWLASLEPVLITRDLDEVHDTGWAVLIQERYRDTLRPIEALRGRFLAASVIAATVVVLMIVALWVFVLVVLSDARGHRLRATWRRWRGLPTLGTFPSPSGTGTGQPSSERSGLRSSLPGEPAMSSEGPGATPNPGRSRGEAG